MDKRSPVSWRDRSLLVVFAAAVLLWPAFLNGGPFWFPDSANYLRAADAAVVTITDAPSEWSDRLVRVPSPATPENVEPNPNSTSDQIARVGEPSWAPSRPVLTGRSIYYGILLYVPTRLIGPWGGIVLQSLIVAGLIVTSLLIAARSIRAEPRVVVSIVVVLAALVTPLPFYTSMLMPDVYSGVLMLVLATIIIFWDEVASTTRVLLIGMSGAMAAFHNTHILITVAVAGAGFLLALRTDVRFRPLLVALPVIAIALLGEVAFSQAVKYQLGQAPLAPPFLSARITASGPGTAYLRQHCSGAPDQFALCAHKERLPLFSDDFLWSEQQKNGLFQLVGSQEQRRISEEDKKFFLAVLANDPVSVISASMQAFMRQLLAFDLNNFNYSAMHRASAPDKLPPLAEEQVLKSLAFERRMPTDFTVASTIAVTLFSILVFGALWGRSVRSQERPLPAPLRYGMLIILGVLANALICGALSKPGARYQMRLIWLIPAAAVVTAFGTRRLSAWHEARPDALVSAEH